MLEAMPLATGTPRLSARVRALAPSGTLAVTQRVRELRAAGHDVIGFGAGEPDFGTPPEIVESAISALRAGSTRYQPVPGTPEARAAIAAKLRRENGIDCGPEHVVITVGAKSALAFALQALVDPGDEVVIPTPAWVSYRPMVELAGGVVVEVPGGVEDDFKVAPEALNAAIGPRTRVVILNSPSNPCGTTYRPEEIKALAEVVAAHDQVTLLSDEIYERLVYPEMEPGIEPASPGALPGIADRVVTVNGLSKAYAMTGWRLGYLAATGPGVAAAVARLQGQVTSHAASFTYPAIVEALEHGDAAVEAMRRVFAARARRLHDQLGAMPGLRCPRPTGAFYCFPDVGAYFGRRSPEGRTIDSAQAFAEALLDEALVAVVPGEEFGAAGARHVRLSFACSDQEIDEGCRRIAGWLERFA